MHPNSHHSPQLPSGTVPRVVRSPIPLAAVRGFPHLVFHWTTRKNAPSILRSGLRRYSWVTPDPRNYKGEVLIGVLMDKAHDWDAKDAESDWQAILPKRIPPSRLFVILEDVLDAFYAGQSVAEIAKERGIAVTSVQHQIRLDMRGRSNRGLDRHAHEEKEQKNG